MSQDDSEDDDYMSDESPPCNANEIPAGQLLYHISKRMYEMEAEFSVCNEQARTKKLRVLEQEQQPQEGLQTQLSSGNRGFDLVREMQYEPGTSLGKSGAGGRLEPVPIAIKSDRAGLSREELLRQKRHEVKGMREMFQLRRQQRLADKSQEFLDHQRTKMLAKQVQRDLYSSQKSCQQLDHKMDLNEPVEPWFWPQIPKPKEDDDSKSSEDDDEAKNELEPEEQLEILTSYLRSTHLFCVRCGTNHDDENCPGNTAADH